MSTATHVEELELENILMQLQRLSQRMWYIVLGCPTFGTDSKALQWSLFILLLHTDSCEAHTAREEERGLGK